MHFQHILREKKSDSPKFRIRWSKVPRVLGPPNRVNGHFSHPAPHGRGRFSNRKTPKMAINRDFRGLRAFSANFAIEKIEERNIPQPMVKSAARFGAPKPSYGHFSHPAGHGRGEFLSRKTPKMAINRNFPALHAFSANFARDKIEVREIRQPMVKSTACFAAPKPSYGDFGHPAGHGRGKCSSRKTPKMAINGDFPGLRAFSANFAGTKSKGAKFRIRWSKVPRVLGPLSRVTAILVTRPPTVGAGFQNKPRFPGAACIFS